ncbi:DEAD/DEAH box helicase [Paenibacillus abyssi]|uniref:DNA 3'-5' helicase n=2 Tax=Paenibacillus abyssi TaxID=1340531 RepID=A0A917D898_9BACL|nr:DNA repair helicase XPB [Paenibacillus abyssi]GGG13076.1 DEAD/DEAH box helicase [Paenibacillus abyssi]
MRKDGSLIIQSDNTVLLDGRHLTSKEAAERLARFADLVKRPGDLHTYRFTPLSVWNACAAGGTAQQMIDTLQAFSKYEVPMTAASNIREWADRYGKLCLRHQHGSMTLTVDCEAARSLLMDKKAVGDALLRQLSDNVWEVKPSERGRLKQELLRQGYPVLDLAGYHAGESLKVALLQETKSGRSFRLRDYQEQAADLFYSEGNVHGGSGVLVLPCGAGKTVVGIAALSRLNCATLILTSNVTSVKQWKNELLDKTTLTPAEVGEYAGPLKQVRPVTIATYQIMTHRSSKQHEYTHMKLFRERDWGLIIYDEVHLLPAPVFRMTAEIQATRRLGLTATLVREDGCEGDVFSLIGPKRFDMPWKQLEQQGWIASVSCTEFRVPLTGTYAECYYQAAPKGKLRLASENPNKADVVQSLLDLHEDKQMLIIGQYLTQLRQLADRFKLPLLTGSTPHHEREMWFNRFKAGDVRALIVSKVANFAIDLPDAAVAVQVSGSFGSRQEEAQRIGRILRPKPNANEAWFYSVVTTGTKETEFALKRQLFMTEQGYQYQLVNWSESMEINGEQAQEVAK